MKRYKVLEVAKKKIPLVIKLELIKISLKTKKQKKIQVKPTTKKPKMYIFLGTDYPNLGDHALTLAHKQFLENNFKEYEVLEFSVDDTLDAIDYLNNIITKQDIITIKGGGNIGIEYFREELLRRIILNSFKDNPIIIFPQTVYFPNSGIGRKELKNTVDTFKERSNIYLFLRDQYSYSLMKKEGLKNIFLVPDIVFSMGSYKKNIAKKNNSVLLCLRNDREKSKNRLNTGFLEEFFINKGYSVSYTDTVVDFEVTKFNRREVLTQKISDFSNSSLIVTDRLHGMIFSYLCETPCLVLETYNHKVIGQYEWIRDSNAVTFVNSEADFKREFEKMEKLMGDYGFNFNDISDYHNLIVSVFKNKILKL
ncbi:polysaccharide pyruvyl transferase family protein [Enterococcus camelliae]|uniref:Polysaccharide pyruvyl transferase family protein n=1 Tax=Enterococcus camelliae TaxID=453959 RepID=A0ABW5TIC9_9ENTE